MFSELMMQKIDSYKNSHAKSLNNDGKCGCAAGGVHESKDNQQLGLL